MAMFYGLNSNTSSNFFNSMLGTNSNNSMFQSLTASLGDYAAIKNGSYRKLVQAYYEKQSKETSDTTRANKTENTATDIEQIYGATMNGGAVTDTNKKQMVEMKSQADSLKKSADALMERGTKSLFRKEDVKDSTTGEISSQFNTEKIYQAVKKFAEDYNSLLSKTSESDSNSILRKGVTMIQDMAAYEDSLQELGIQMKEDGTLAIDEEVFKKADMQDVKSMFNGSISVSAKIYQKASDIYNLSANAALSNSLYNNEATYINTLSGTLYNNYF